MAPIMPWSWSGGGKPSPAAVVEEAGFVYVAAETQRAASAAIAVGKSGGELQLDMVSLLDLKRREKCGYLSDGAATGSRSSRMPVLVALDMLGRWRDAAEWA